MNESMQSGLDACIRSVAKGKETFCNDAASACVTPENDSR